MHSHGFYVTGTDTGIGKTAVSVALLHVLRARGLRAIGMKPVASGCTSHVGDGDPPGWRNEDALALQAASDPRPRYGNVNPYAFPLPLAPELAARDANVDVELQVMVDAHGRLQAMADQVVVEGVGGWAAPLSPALMQADLVRALEIPVMLVVGLRLGCINHAILSARAIVADGCRLLGWVGNAIDPHMERRDAHRALLEARIDAPCCGWLPYLTAADAVVLSRYLVIPGSPAFGH